MNRYIVCLNGMASGLSGSLLSRIQRSEFSVAIVGLGYVGLPLAFLFAQSQIQVIGIDSSTSRIEGLCAGKIPFQHLNTAINRELLDGSYIKLTTSFSHINEVDVIIVCVPTPITKHLEPDLSFVYSACNDISNNLRSDQLLILESTTYPGTTDEIIVPLLESKGFEVGRKVYLGYSPEREDPANSTYSTRTIPKIVSGITNDCLICTQAVYSHVVDTVVPVSSTRVGELTKLVENIHRSVNIGLMNELKPLCNKMGIDIFEVIHAASTKPFGFTPYFPGPGLGGHCIPIDPFYLSWKAKEYGVRTRFIELAGEINADMPNYVIDSIATALNKFCKPIRGASILLLGLAYKKNIEDLRSSPAVTIFEKLVNLGGNISYVDPFVPEIKIDNGITYYSSALNASILASSAVTVLLTDHDCFDYNMILEESRYIIDTRGRYCVGKKVARA